MNSTVKVGQALYLKMRFNNVGDISETEHPYIIFKVDSENNILEIIQLDSIKPKNMKRLLHYRTRSGISPTFIVPLLDPKETVISKDSFAQLDNQFFIENFDGIEKFRPHVDKLSDKKLVNLFLKYEEYHRKEFIDENKQVYVTKDELLKLNC